MRALSSASVATVAAAACLLSAPAAYADGDNGTVKIHDAATDEELRKNEPKVCSFYLDAFGFDGRQQVTWKIVEMPPTGTRGTVAETGGLILDADGHERTEDLSLKDGHYKLVWNFEGENGRAEHKAFWVDCDGVLEGAEEAGGQVTAATPSPSSTAETVPEPAGSGEASPVPAPETSEAAGGGERPSGDLAATGSSVPAGALAAAAASMLGAGTYLVLRRRNARSERG